MGSLVDAKFAAMRGLGYTGAVSDMTLQWLQANGATSNSVPDAWLEMLESKGFGSSGQPPPNGDVVMGNVARYGEIPQITVPAGDDFTLSFDWIRPTIPEVPAGQRVFDTDDESCFMTMMAVNNAGFPNWVRFKMSGVNYDFVDALVDVALGQHVSVEVTRTGSTLSLSIDGVDKGTNTASDLLKIDTIASASTFALAVGSALQNFEVRNTTTGERWFFPLDEGSGTVINNTDPVTGGPGTEGAWTPDADWQQIAPAVGYQRSDQWFAYLRSLGHTGSINDMELQFWESQ